MALGTTTLAWLFCMIQLSSNFAELSADATFHSPDFLPFFLGVGPILFSYGGASTFPTIQNDMQHRDKFNRSVILGFIGEPCEKCEEGRRGRSCSRLTSQAITLEPYLDAAGSQI